jgi:hypothetical protein
LANPAANYHGEVKYFAFGSNMDLDQKKLRGPEAELLGSAALSGRSFRISGYGAA